MNVRACLVAVLLSVAMGMSGVAWAGSACQLDDGTSGGSSASAASIGATACGESNTVTNFSSGANAFGYGNETRGLYANAFGYGNVTQANFASAFGYGNHAMRDGSSAFGYSNKVSGDLGSAFGYTNQANGSQSSAFGFANTANGGQSSAFGFSNKAAGSFSAAFGAYSDAGYQADFSIVFGVGEVDGDGANVADHVTSAIAIGHTVNVNANDGVAIGHGSMVQTGAAAAVALGSGSIADTANTFSIGSSTLQRRIVNVAAGMADTDAVNLSQLESVTALFGDGASFAGGVFDPPTFTIQGTSYNDVGAAFDAVDAGITDLYAKAASGGSAPTGGATMTQVQAGDAATLKSANTYTDTQTQEALQSARTYADAGDAATLTKANAYTDSKVAAGFVTRDAFDQFQNQVGEHFHQVDVRMARIGAMGQAIGGMAGAIAGGDRTNNRISAAVGSYSGQNAMAVGYSHLLPGHGSVLVGGTVSSGGETGGTVGVSFGW